MKRLSVQYLPWLLWTFGVALAVVLIPVQHVLVPAVAGDTLALQIAIDVVVIALATIGAVIASRHPENPIGWLVLLFPFFAVIGVCLIDRWAS